MNDYRCDWCGQKATRFFRNKLYLISSCGDCVIEPEDLLPSSPLDELSVEEFMVTEIIEDLPRAFPTTDSHGVFFYEMALDRCR
jgi:organic radical activating enzyme